MKKEKNIQILVIAVLTFVVLFMSIGFASYTSKLNINGNVSVGASKWSIHFVDSTYTESAGSIAASSTSITNTSVSYTINLVNPGDFYEFTINVINDGTFDANLTAITMSALTPEQQAHLVYKITYNDVEYTSSASGLSVALPYASGTNTKSVKVRVEYLDNGVDLEEDMTDITLTASLDYTQAS